MDLFNNGDRCIRNTGGWWSDAVQNRRPYYDYDEDGTVFLSGTSHLRTIGWFNLVFYSTLHIEAKGAGNYCYLYTYTGNTSQQWKQIYPTSSYTEMTWDISDQNNWRQIDVYVLGSQLTIKRIWLT